MRNSCSGDVTSVTGTVPGVLPGRRALAVAPVAAAGGARAMELLDVMEAGWSAERDLGRAAVAAGVMVPPSMVAVLLRLDHEGGPLPAQAIGRDLYTGTNLSYGLRALERAGLVAVTAHPRDRRAKLVAVSDAGRRAVAVILAELEG